MSTAQYWSAHNLLIQELRKLGIHHGFKDRLPLAYYRHSLPKLAGEWPEHIVKLLDTCVTLRREGFEPPHKEDRYT